MSVLRAVRIANERWQAPKAMRVSDGLKSTLARFSSNSRVYARAEVPLNKQKFVPISGTYPKGFSIGSTYAGIKSVDKYMPDLVLVASERPSCGAAVFTKQEFPASSITVSKQLLQKTKGHGLRGIIVNSGCANVFTGKQGLEDSLVMSRKADTYVSGEKETGADSAVMVMHTGAGARRLPIDKIVQSMPTLHHSMGNSHENWLEAACGISTTDTFPKLTSRTFTLPSSPHTTFSIAGITKGAGMIHPNMATTLGVICTDAPITPDALQQLLSAATDKSYNCISVDGDTSTNDMVAMLANGAAGGPEITYSSTLNSQSDDYVAIQRVLTEFMSKMARLVVRDGEGATKFITIRVRDSPSYAAARHIASAIAKSILFKISMYGKDADWACAVIAMGYSLLDTEFAGQGIVVPEQTSVSFVSKDGEQLRFFDKGTPIEVDGLRAKSVMEQEDIEIMIELRDGAKETANDLEEAVYWTCDMTHDYVSFNGGFSS